MTNLAGQKDAQETLTKLKIARARWRVREGDYLPIPSLKYPEHHEFSVFRDKPLPASE